MTTDQPKPRRRFFRYSLRTLMLVVTVFCVWLGVTAKRAQDQRQAVVAIYKLGGRVLYDHQIEESDPPGPAWLRQLIGVEYFFNVARVYLRKPDYHGRNSATRKRFTDADLEHLTGLVRDLKRFSELQFLDLRYTQVTDEGLMHLKGLTNLLRLYLDDTQVTDAGLVRLKELTKLQFLFLTDNQVTDEGLVHLKGLTNLRWLLLGNTQVTDEGVQKLQQALPYCTIYY